MGGDWQQSRWGICKKILLSPKKVSDTLKTEKLYLEMKVLYLEMKVD